MRLWPVSLSDAHQTWTETLSVAGSRPISSHRAAIVGRACGHLARRHAVDVELVRVARREPPGDVLAVAADHDRDARLLNGERPIDGVVDRMMLALIGGSTLAHHRV